MVLPLAESLNNDNDSFLELRLRVLHFIADIFLATRDYVAHEFFEALAPLCLNLALQLIVIVKEVEWL